MPNNPKEYKYSKDHEWLRIEDDGTTTVGITTYAVEHLGDMVFVDLNEAGGTIKQNESAGTLESVKAAADLFTPIGGEIIARNDAVIDDPAALNQDAFAAWLIKVRPDNLEADLATLMSSDEYDDYEASQ